MNARYRPLVALFALLVAGLVVLEDSPGSLAAGGLLNPGFESGTLDGNPVSWNVQTPVADVVRVVDTEGFNEFPTYADMGNVTVSPYKGDRMLRLGTPQRLAQNQNKGNNIVTQTYFSTSPKFRTASRGFSWEYRGQDLIKINIEDLSIPGPNKSVGDLAGGVGIGGCTGIPCQFSLDAGNQGDFLDTGWVPMEIINLPFDDPLDPSDPVVNLRVTYQVSGTKDGSKPTWAYFDNVNTPPVPQFVSAPASPFEGDIVQFIDQSFDPDPGDSIASWSWSIDTVPFNVQSPLFIFPNQGTYSASLTVTDTFGDSATITKQIAVQNAVPLVNALNTEAVEGHQTTLIGRFLDTGWEDAHSAVIDLNGITDPSDEMVEEENEPLLSTGLVTATVTPPVVGPVTGNTLTVNDEGAPGGSDSFNLTVLPANTARNRFEGTTGNNTVATATTLEADTSYVDFVPEEGDIDVFKVVLPGGATIDGGGELQATLHDLHADLDVAILADPPDTATFAASRFAASRFGTSHFAASRFDSSTIAASRFAASRFAASRFAASRFGDFKIGLSNFNESGVSWADLAASRFAASRFAASRFAASRFANEVTPVDVTLEELGLAGIAPEGIQLADFSANRGFDGETAVAKSPLDGTEFYVVVFGANGAYTNDPVSLSLEVIEPSNLEADLGAACQGSVLVPAPGTETSVLHDFGGVGVAAETVIVTQDQRMRAVYGDAAVDEMLANLVVLADDVPGGADILSPSSVFYDEWDKHPCSIQEANNTAMAIRQEIQTRYPNVKNIVIAGTDKIVPFYRIPDNTVVANEKGYLFDSFAKPGTPLFASILQGFVIIDDFYADDSPDAFDAGELWVPDKGIGRLVETPQEIGAQALAGVASNFRLTPDNAFVSGHTFFQDGATELADALGSRLPTDRMIDDTWDSEDLRCRWLGDSTDPLCATTEAPDVSSPNGHATHYAIESAADFFTGDFGNSVFTSELEVPAGGSAVLGGRVVFSMGCHFGTSSEDAASEAGDAALGLDPAADWPQVMAQQRAALLWASTGYGIGDDEGIAGTEKLMGIFADKLLDGGTAGDAAVAAKAEYISGLATVSVYDTKSSMQTVMYGLPMYEIEVATSAGVTLQAVPVQEQTTPSPLSITTIDNQSDVPLRQTSHFLDPVTAATGTYYNARSADEAPGEGESVATEGRVIQPTLDLNLDERHPFSTPPDPVHGVLLSGGTYDELPMFNPVFAQPTFEFHQIGGPVDICQRGFSPSQADSLNAFKLKGKVRPTLVLVPGQFRCTDVIEDPNPDDLDGAVRGTELRWSSLSYEVLRCPDTVPPDTTPADIGTVEVRSLGPTTVQVRVPASDESGVVRVIVYQFSNGTVTLHEPDVLPASGPYNVEVENYTSADELQVSVVDGGCNVATESAKSAGINGKGVDAGPDRSIPPSTPVTLSATVKEFDPDLAANFFWDFGDGTNASGILAPADIQTVTVTPNPDGSATFGVQHTYATLPQTATVRVFDAAGGTGSDDVRFVCDVADNPAHPEGDLIGCGASNTNTSVTFSLMVTGLISNDVHYRIGLDVGRKQGKKFVQPPDGLEDQRVQYNNGMVSGVAGATAQLVGPSELQITVPLSSLGLQPCDRIQWFAEAQTGSGNPGTGQVDRLPESGWLSHKLERSPVPCPPG